MNGKLELDAHALMREIARYLAAVDAFRAEFCEPTWLPEHGPGVDAKTRRSPRRGAQGSRSNRA